MELIWTQKRAERTGSIHTNPSPDVFREASGLGGLLEVSSNNEFEGEWRDAERKGKVLVASMIYLSCADRLDDSEIFASGSEC